MTITVAQITPLVALIAGILILLVPRLLNYIVAIYLIIVSGGKRLHFHGLPEEMNWNTANARGGAALSPTLAELHHETLWKHSACSPRGTTKT